MNWRKFYMVAAVVAAFVLLILYLTVWIAQPVLKDRLEARLNGLDPGYHIELGNLNIHLLQKSIDVSQIEVTSMDSTRFQLQIETLQVRNIRLLKALFSKEYHIGVVALSGLQISASLADSGKKSKPLIIPFPLQIDRFICKISKLGFSGIPDIGHVSGQSGYIRLDDLIFAKDDSFQLNQLQKFQFSFEYISVQTTDSNYLIKVDTIQYNTYRQTLFIGRIRLKPAFEHYVFAARTPWQSDRFDIDAKQITVDHFSLIHLISNKELVCRKIEMGNAWLEVFRDKRRPFKHESKPLFTEMMYRYPGKLQIDSLVVTNSDIVYLEHNPDATKAGKITFTNAEFKLANITNDSLNSGSFNLKGRAILMGKSQVSVELIAKHFDRLGTFQVKGSIQEMEISAFNPMLEESAFVTVRSGKLRKIKFSFFANQHLAAGDMMMIYNDLNLALLDSSNKKDPGLKTRLQTWLLNKMIMDSNPLKEEPARKGIIRYKRDPERFLFNYCAKAIFSGVKSTLLKK
jgi:hypothetical protein